MSYSAKKSNPRPKQYEQLRSITRVGGEKGLLQKWVTKCRVAGPVNGASSQVLTGESVTRSGARSGETKSANPDTESVDTVAGVVLPDLRRSQQQAWVRG